MLSQILKSAYIKANPPSEGISSSTMTAGDVGPGQSPNPVFPMIRPMKTTLYLDDIEGFGEWSILLSTRAQKDIRDVKGADGAVFRIVMKKIKWDLPLYRDDCC